jgi:hypothetical protein
MSEGRAAGERDRGFQGGAQAAPFRIFLNYRRDDSAGHVGRLWDALRSGAAGQPGFADEQIFIDIDTIEPGVDFRDAIRKAVEVSDVFLAVIGKQWLSASDSKGRRRLDDPGDFVRIEIEAALERAAEHNDVRVVPTRVQGAEMPGLGDLPNALAELAHRNAVELTDERWHYDVGRLLAWLKKLEREKEERAELAGEGEEASLAGPVGEPSAEEEREPEDASRGAVVPRPEREERQREKERRARLRKAGAGAAIVAVLAVGAGLLIGLLRNGDEPTEGQKGSQGGNAALVWRRTFAGGLGGHGDQAMTSIVDTEKPGLAYVAGGYDAASGQREAAIWTSKDGRAWARSRVEAEAGRSGKRTITSVTAFAGRLIAVGRDDSAGNLDVAYATSRDGIHWRSTALDAPGDQLIKRVTNTRIEGVRAVVGGGSESGDGADAAVWLFPGGEASTSAPVSAPAFGGPGDQRISRVVQLGAEKEQRLVAVGFAAGDAAAWVSKDGRGWKRVDAAALGGDGHQEILDATVFESNVVAVGRDGARGAVWLSPDGRTWARVADPNGAFAGSGRVRLNRVILSHAGASGVPPLVAGGSVGDDAAVWTSKDGREWAREPDPDGVFGGRGEKAIQSLRATRKGGVIAVGSSEEEDGLDAAVWIGAPK